MALTALKIAMLYALFALLSTVINIGLQMQSIRAYKGPCSVKVLILAGTFVGLPLCYFLEKYYLLNLLSQYPVKDGKLFDFYSAMGVIGLAVSFYIKYQSDKKYVFVNRISEVQQ